MTESSDQRGPWALALGAVLVGVVAITIEGYRVVRRRLQRSDSSDDSSDST